MKPIALAFSDIHINKWKETYNYKGDRLGHGCKALALIIEAANKLNVPILFCGDLFHKPKHIDNEVFDAFIETYKKNEPKGEFIAISGNHDQCHKNTLIHKSPSYINSLSKVLSNFHCLDGKSIISDNFIVYGIPYLTHNRGFKEYLNDFKIINSKNKFKILLLHSDLPGAKNGFNFEIGEVKNIPTNLDKFFKGFDLVLSGHIHKPQKLGKHIYMLGATNHQNAGDMGVDMGYWEIYKTKPPVFIKLPLPEYRPLKKGSPIPDSFHIYVPRVKKANTISVSQGSFNNKMSREEMAKNYMEKKEIKSKSKKKALVKILIES